MNIRAEPCSCTNPDDHWLILIDNRSTGATYPTAWDAKCAIEDLQKHQMTISLKAEVTELKALCARAADALEGAVPLVTSMDVQRRSELIAELREAAK